MSQNRALTSANLGSNNIGDEGATAIATAIAQNNTLTSINLSWNNIYHKGARFIAGILAQNKTLTSIDLGNNKIGANGAGAISTTIKQNRTLTSIDLRHNDIGLGGAKVIATSITKNHTLTSIDLCGNNIGDKGATFIADSLAQNHTLTSINLGNNKIGDEGASAILKSLTQNRTLTFIVLHINNISSNLQKEIESHTKNNYQFLRNAEEVLINDPENITHEQLITIKAHLMNGSYKSSLYSRKALVSIMDHLRGKIENELLHYICDVVYLPLEDQMKLILENKEGGMNYYSSPCDIEKRLAIYKYLYPELEESLMKFMEINKKNESENIYPEENEKEIMSNLISILTTIKFSPKADLSEFAQSMREIYKSAPEDSPCKTLVTKLENLTFPSNPEYESIHYIFAEDEVYHQGVIGDNNNNQE
ncbi:MAG: hypothetical protein SFT68_00955 [Rickettsiaceae bacterium]|nr:hypothetical protein [Rickettsiaceae bacterium]